VNYLLRFICVLDENENMESVRGVSSALCDWFLEPMHGLWLEWSFEKER
jgi:hypothetical protein